jgi:hypothetical protein
MDGVTENNSSFQKTISEDLDYVLNCLTKIIDLNKMKSAVDVDSNNRENLISDMENSQVFEPSLREGGLSFSGSK